MTWADFYLICFAVGFLFSVLSFLLGGFRWHLPFHLHLGGGHAHPGIHAHAGATSAGHGAAAAGHGHGAAQISPFNPPSLAAFLAWFGGAGYLLMRYSTLWLVIALGVALLSGLAGAAIVFLFLSRVLMSPEESLDPADYEMVGVLGRVSSSIREGGTGEIIYSQAGTRHTCGARAEEGRAIAKGSEVVVTRYEKGIAYVRLWTEMAGEQDQVSAESAGEAKEQKQ